MGAGDSARRVAERADAKALRHLERAASLRGYAGNFRKGAVGEEALDAVLMRLVQRGWHPLPDRRSPTGGNIDELLVGPAGVAVLDAKNWSYPLKVRDDQLFTGRFPHKRELQHIVDLVDVVRAAVARLRLGPVAVKGFMALVGDADRTRTAEEVNGIWICGLSKVEHGFSVLPIVHPPHVVDQIAAAVGSAFPPN